MWWQYSPESTNQTLRTVNVPTFGDQGARAILRLKCRLRNITAYNAFVCKDTPAVGSFRTEACSRLIVKGVLLTRSVAHLILHKPNQQHTIQFGSSCRRYPRIEIYAWWRCTRVHRLSVGQWSCHAHFVSGGGLSPHLDERGIPGWSFTPGITPFRKRISWRSL